MSSPIKIRPAGMTYDRALEIAVECDRRNQFRSRPQLEPVPHGRVLSPAHRALILRSSDTSKQLAAQLHVSERQVQRVRAQAAEDRAWRADQKRRKNLESFRRMDTVWEETA